MAEKDFLGIGESYPFKPNGTGGVLLISDRELIKQSISDILGTPKGTILGVEEYGCLIYRLAFVPNDAVLQSLLIFLISEALFNWEKRITVISIDCNTVSLSQTDCTITYITLASNEIDAFVFPFYKELKS